MKSHRFDALIIDGNKKFDVDYLIKTLIVSGIDIVCVAGVNTADPGFLLQEAAKAYRKILVIPGAVLHGSSGIEVLVVGAVDRIVVPSTNTTVSLVKAVHSVGGAVVALYPKAPADTPNWALTKGIIDTPNWALIDGSVVWGEERLHPRTVPVALAITGYDFGKIGQVYTDIDFDGSIESYDVLTKLMITNPEKFVPVVYENRYVA